MRESKQNAMLQLWDTLEQENVSRAFQGQYYPPTWGEKVADALNDLLSAGNLTEHQMTRLEHLLYVVCQAKQESLSE